jgi:SAM-dependent methyltransferase
MGEAARRKRLKQAIEAAKTPDGLAVERETYARNWSEGDAAKFATDGHYAWMASHLSSKDRVLEIGTGDGRGTIELLRAGHVVVSVDENPACLGRATKNISDAGFSVKTELRGTPRQGEGGYVVKYEPIAFPAPTAGALLIEGDTLNDPDLLSWLKSLPPFDAVTCWLMGSHRARQLNLALRMESADLYRLRVQNNLYVFADTILQSGGVLNIVDRGAIGTTPATISLLTADTVQSHGDQASPTSLQIDEQVETRPYAAPSGGLKMEATVGSAGIVLADIELGLVSTIARKR